MKKQYTTNTVPTLAFVLLNLTVAYPTQAEEAVSFSEFSFEELLDVVVTSVSKKEQKIADAAAAIHVISQDDIRRSGANTVADALRMVPGLQVARINAHAWAVSSRGFNDYFANKLLVLVDGRTVYTPEFSGVYWDSVTPPLDDIDRIEVIRGPGGTLWGANAVNGVINIISKDTADSQGTLVVAGAGEEDKAIVRLRHGGKMNEKTHYRVYATHTKRDNGALDNAKDAWRMSQAGFRVDGTRSEKDNWTLQGDTYQSTQDEMHLITQQPGEADIKGSHLIGRWSRTFSEKSDMTLQAYYDFNERNSPTVEISNHVFDLDFQHHYVISDKHELLWGLGYRRLKNEIPDAPLAPPFVGEIKFTPATREDDLWSAFIQDEIKLLPDKLVLTVGSKFEYNDYTGFEIQPNLRFMWTPTEKTSVWGALSRAVHTPSRVDQDLSIQVMIPPGVSPHPCSAELLASIPPGMAPPPACSVPLNNMTLGNKDAESDEVISYELGIRSQSSETFSWDAALFLNFYDKILGPDNIVDTSFSQGAFIFATQQPTNAFEATTYGLELIANWTPKDWWRLQFAYAFLDLDLALYKDLTTDAHTLTEKKSPQHTFSLRSSMDLSKDWQFDLWLRHVSELEALEGSVDSNFAGVNAYTTLDARLAWQVAKGVELSIIGQNLLEQKHREFQRTTFNPLSSLVERSVYVQLRWELE